MPIVLLRTKHERQAGRVPLGVQIAAAGLPVWTAEYRFAPPRQWRFDLAWPDAAYRIACEIEGGTWTGGRHTRAAAFEQDCEKYNQAAINGWLLIRATTTMVRSGAGLRDLERAFLARGWRR